MTRLALFFPLILGAGRALEGCSDGNSGSVLVDFRIELAPTVNLQTAETALDAKPSIRGTRNRHYGKRRPNSTRVPPVPE